MAINIKQGTVGIVSEKESVVGSLGISVSGVTEQYEGEYEVTPLVTHQTLPTKKKVMKDNLTIKEIPFFDVSNNAGGTTVYIGEEIEIYGD